MTIDHKKLSQAAPTAPAVPGVIAQFQQMNVISGTKYAATDLLNVFFPTPTE